VPILVYHKVDPDFEWGITRVTPLKFESQIRYLYEQNYISLTLSEYDNLSDSQMLSGEKYVVITFDDAYQSVYLYALPILKKYNFKTTVFVITDYIGRYNTWDVNLGKRQFLHTSIEELKEFLDNGFEIASHSRSHPDLINIPLSKAREELAESKVFLEKKLNTNVNYISYPFGRANSDIIEITKEIGYIKGCLLQGFLNQYNKEDVIYRKGVYLCDTTRTLKTKLDENNYSSFENFKLWLINKCSTATLIVKSYQN